MITLESNYYHVLISTYMDESKIVGITKDKDIIMKCLTMYKSYENRGIELNTSVTSFEDFAMRKISTTHENSKIFVPTENVFDNQWYNLELEEFEAEDETIYLTANRRMVLMNRLMEDYDGLRKLRRLFGDIGGSIDELSMDNVNMKLAADAIKNFNIPFTKFITIFTASQIWEKSKNSMEGIPVEIL